MKPHVDDGPLTWDGFVLSVGVDPSIDVLEVGFWSIARRHSSPIFCLSLEFIGHGRVLHARELVGDSVEDMLVLLTSDAFHPIAESDSGDLANMGDGV